jgi:hypothetical protein
MKFADPIADEECCRTYAENNLKRLKRFSQAELKVII